MKLFKSGVLAIGLTTLPYADAQQIDVSAIDIPDTKFNPVGVRGIGEIGITGTGAAIANAIFHATGKRVRDLPITPDTKSPE